MKKFNVFLSYSSKGKLWARRLASSLKKQGLEVWLGEEQLSPGANIAKTIVDGLGKSKMVVTVVDPKSVSSPNIFFEAGMAVGLGKDVTFVVPEAEVSSGRLPFEVSRGKAVIRRTPSATARELIQVKKLKI